MGEPKNPYNGSNRLDNCGFCAIAYGLDLQNGRQVDAEELFRETMKRLDIEDKQFPRTLLFSEANLDQIPTPAHRKVLSERTRSPFQYTIQHVATENGLKWNSGFHEFLGQYAQIYNVVDSRAAIDQMARVRHEAALNAGNQDSFEAFKQRIADKLVGEAIVGSITGRHFLNVRISPSGLMEGFDPQVNERFPGRDLLLRVRGPISLFMRVPAGM